MTTADRTPNRRRSSSRSLVASEQVAQAIRAFIAEHGLQPGDRVGREDDLARRFGVSRPTLREALRLLASTGRIRASKGPGGGIFVNQTVREGLSDSVSRSIEHMLEAEEVTIDELLATRGLLEVALAGAAARQATKQDIDDLRNANSRFDTTGNVHWDAEFHRIIARTAGNRVARALADWTFDVLQPSLVEVTASVIEYPRIVEQHQAILDAIDRRDIAEAENGAQAHIDYLASLLRLMETERPRGRNSRVRVEPSSQLTPPLSD